ncbi:MAG: hypothetical protein HY701_12275 [Gemmatimonadetes bacterium]|nr:hypothetical protein [Gemmatimonadota bacterium]
MLVLAAAQVLLAGCGEVASGGARGEVSAYVAGDGPGGSASAVAGTSALLAGSAWETPAGNAVKGTVTLRAQVFVSAPNGPWIEVTEGEREAVVDAEGAQEKEVGRRLLDAGIYSRMRIVFTRVDVDVTDGLVIDGIPIVGRVAVNFGGTQRIEVELPISLTLAEDAEVDLVVDLNAQGWLRSANPVTRVVPAAVFRNAVEVRVRP